MINFEKIAIIIQGPTKVFSEINGKLINCYKEQKKYWTNYSSNLIFSTWENEENDFENDTIIFNTYPENSGRLHLWYQQKSTMEGLKLAKKMNFEYALKLRSDMVITNPDNFFKILDLDKLNFLAWNTFESYPKNPGYFLDFLMFGPIDEMIKLWDIKEDFANGPEIMLTDSYIKNCSIDINYFLNKLTEDNDIHWLKKDIKFSFFPLKKNLPPQCNHPWYKFSFQKEFLNKNYLNFLK